MSRDISWAIRGWALVLALVLAIGMGLVVGRAASAAETGQIVQPGDVATPTPTFAVILVPTPTPAATPEALPLGEEFAAAAMGVANSSYVVQPGDTLLTVALEVGLDVAEVPCAVSPDFRPEEPLVIGHVLGIPEIGWRCRRVEAGESLAEIAADYGMAAAEIAAVAWNDLDGLTDGAAALMPGRYLRIPPRSAEDAGGFLGYMLTQPLGVSPLTAYAVGGPRAKSAVAGPLPKDWPYGSGLFVWPVFGWLSQGYRDDHRAIDIAARAGAWVTAADRGVVVRAGWNDQGYGLFVVIDHNIDYMTLYGHLSEVYVREGDVVAQGQVLGTVGSTGNSTGPHLHFEIRDFGQRTNPLGLLTR
jgi:murein DD-endopeptidase MepM/ murein hydrolase activator NlpD